MDRAKFECELLDELDKCMKQICKTSMDSGEDPAEVMECMLNVVTGFSHVVLLDILNGFKHISISQLFPGLPTRFKSMLQIWINLEEKFKTLPNSEFRKLFEKQHSKLPYLKHIKEQIE
jgi:hypothetical protein